MKTCKKCSVEKTEDDFYKGDSKCKECRKEMVRLNRESKIEYYREYDKKRFKEDPRVRERHIRYQKTEEGKISVLKSQRKYIEKNPVKRATHIILGNAVKYGKLKKPIQCESCGGRSRLHGHHDDYALPLVVRWLCAPCHSKWHEENGEGLNGQ